MFCANCGNTVDEGATFCGKCGMAVQPADVNQGQAAAANADGQPVSQAAAGENVRTMGTTAEGNMQQSAMPEPGQTGTQNYSAGAGGVYRADGAAAPADGGKPEKKKTGLIIGMAAAAAVIVILILLVSSLLGGSYKTPLDKAVSLVNKKETNLDAYASAILPKFAKKAYQNGMGILAEYDEFEDMLDMVKDSFEYIFDEAEYEVGSNWKYSYKITSKERMDEEELKYVKKNYKDLRDDLKDMDSYIDKDGYYYDDLKDEIGADNMKKLQKLVQDLETDLRKIKITDGYYLEGELTLKGSDDKEVTDFNIRVIKINGKWTFDFLNFYYR